MSPLNLGPQKSGPRHNNGYITPNMMPCSDVFTLSIQSPEIITISFDFKINVSVLWCAKYKECQKVFLIDGASPQNKIAASLAIS